MTSGDPPPELASLAGLPVAEAVATVERLGYVARVLSSEHPIATLDRRFNRVNLWHEGGRVTRVCAG
ncbi:MAG: hypothetical protein ACRDYZ_08170 [Acidimicrobiales bacterium]